MQRVQPAAAAPTADDEEPDLRERLAALEQENADLKSGKTVPPTSAATPAPAATGPAEEAKAESPEATEATEAAELAPDAAAPAEEPTDQHVVPFTIKLSEMAKHKVGHGS